MSVKKSARNSAPGKPFRKGRDPRRGRGPEKGAPNAGRPPDAFKEMCRKLASSDDVEGELTSILKKRRGKGAKRDPEFMAALKWTSENGYGKPSQAIVPGDGLNWAEVFKQMAK